MVDLNWRGLKFWTTSDSGTAANTTGTNDITWTGTGTTTSDIVYPANTLGWDNDLEAYCSGPPFKKTTKKEFMVGMPNKKPIEYNISTGNTINFNTGGTANFQINGDNQAITATGDVFIQPNTALTFTNTATSSARLNFDFRNT